jgi:hypothetical protein
MKNILSSLNESEKKRILEMHYKASGRQYLMEKPATQKTTTAQTYKQKIDAQVSQLYSDYFSFGFMEGSSEKDGAIFQIYPKSNNTYYFENVGDSNKNALYYCKAGWGEGNPFESNITLKYKSQTPATNKGEAGLKISEAAEKLVNAACSKIGQSVTQKTTTTPSNVPKKLTPPSELADDVGGYLLDSELDLERSKQGDEVVTVKSYCNSKDGLTNADFIMKTNDGREFSIKCRTAKYSCKFKKWSSSENPTVPTSQWVSETGGFGSMPMALPKGKTLSGSYSDIGKKPDELANMHGEYMCSNLKWQ